MKVKKTPFLLFQLTAINFQKISPIFPSGKYVLMKPNKKSWPTCPFAPPQYITLWKRNPILLSEKLNLHAPKRDTEAILIYLIKTNMTHSTTEFYFVLDKHDH